MKSRATLRDEDAAPEPGKSVFLSYASQDAETVRKICEALRAAGIEVWFDESELRGGDTWDQKIRQQIRDCALFVPIVSRHTQARPEGYFRLEWKLAVDRSHLMATEKAFLVPIVVDATSESEALVPARFREVQWTRLRKGEIPTTFVDRIAALINQPVASHMGDPVRKVGREPLGRHPIVLTTLSVAAVVALVTAAAMRGGWLSQKPDSVVNTAFGTAPPPATRSAAISEESVAVLPFIDMSEKSNQEYFADGLSEEIIDRLSHVQRLRVIARTSSFYFKGRNETIPVIGSTLNVSHVLEGSVRKSGSTLRITAQLVRTSDSSHVWSQTYERSMAEVFAVQTDIASQVAVALKLALVPESDRQAPTQSVEAYNELLRGQYFENRWQQGDLEKAIAAYREAIRFDPNYLDAWLALSGAYADESLGRPREASRELAFDAARRALLIDPMSAHAHRVQGNIAWTLQWDLTLAASEYQQALALAPNRNESLRTRYELEHLRAIRTGSYGQQYWALLEEGARLNPLDVRLLTEMGFYCIYGGQLQKGIDLLNRAYSLSPTGGNIGAAVSYALFLSSRLPEARKMAESLGSKEDARQVLTMIAWSEGNHDESNRRLADLERVPGGTGAFTFAQIHAWRGERDVAFQYLDRALQERDTSVLTIRVDPILRRLDGDHRYQALVQRLRLSE